MTQEQFDTVEVGDTCQGMSWDEMFKGTVIHKDDDSVVLTGIVGRGPRGGGMSSCSMERLELLKRGPLSQMKKTLTDMRPALVTLLDLTEE